LCTQFGKGREHDFKLFKRHRLPIGEDKQAWVDSGYQGIQHRHPNSQLPHRRSKKKPLTAEQKRENRYQASQRIMVEHVIAWLKRFKIIADTYRNRRKRFGLRFNLIAAIYNFERQ
jgi:hypothetical protein